MLIRLLQDIEDWGGGLFKAQKIIAADDKIAHRWIAQGKAESLFPGVMPEPVTDLADELRLQSSRLREFRQRYGFDKGRSSVPPS